MIVNVVFQKLFSIQSLRSKSYNGILLGFISVLVALASTRVIFPAEYSVVVIAFVSLLLSPYVLKNFELDELNVDLTEVRDSDGFFAQVNLERWVSKCLRDGYTPTQIKNSLIANNLDKDVLLLHQLGLLEDMNTEYMRKSTLFWRHSKTIKFYSNLFLGMFLGFLWLYLFSSADFRSVVFKHQEGIIYGPAGRFSDPVSLTGILVNNLGITLICVVLSLLYGTGAIFILSYNASVAGVLYGGFINSELNGSQTLLVLRYLPHTTLEILAYLIAAVAGGLLSKAIIESEPGGGKMMADDGLRFLGVSILLTVIAAVVEVVAI